MFSLCRYPHSERIICNMFVLINVVIIVNKMFTCVFAVQYRENRVYFKMEWEIFYLRPHPGKYSRNSASSRKEDELLKEKLNGWASWSNTSLSSSPHVCLLHSSVHVCQRWLHTALRWFQSHHLRNISCLQYILIWMTMVWKYKPRWKLKIWHFFSLERKKKHKEKTFGFLIIYHFKSLNKEY